MNDWHVRTLVWGRIYARRLLPHVRTSSNLLLGEDTALNLLFLYSVPDVQIAVISEKLYYYFQRPSSLVHTVPHYNKVNVSIYFMNHYDDIKGNIGQSVICHEIARNMLSYRYLKRLSVEKEEMRGQCKEMFRFVKSKWSGILPTKYKVAYFALYYCPFLYRLLRIITDPTMLNWERAEKKRQREKANESVC